MKLFNKSLFQSTAFYAVICFLASAATIILLTYPWVLHFGDGFLNHWDPPFHAWKLKYMATEVLRGNLFFHNPNSNVLYPYSGTLFFEALQWPQALFGALILLFFPLCSDVLLYHISLIFFWALSAPCFYLLMKRMGVSNFCSIVF